MSSPARPVGGEFGEGKSKEDISKRFFGSKLRTTNSELNTHAECAYDSHHFYCWKVGQRKDHFH